MFLVNPTAMIPISAVTITGSLEQHILLNTEEMAGWCLTCLVGLAAKGVLLMDDCRLQLRWHRQLLLGWILLPGADPVCFRENDLQSTSQSCHDKGACSLLHGLHGLDW
jgi:hypothetical protein